MFPRERPRLHVGAVGKLAAQGRGQMDVLIVRRVAAQVEDREFVGSGLQRRGLPYLAVLESGAAPILRLEVDETLVLFVLLVLPAADGVVYLIAEIRRNVPVLRYAPRAAVGLLGALDVRAGVLQVERGDVAYEIEFRFGAEEVDGVFFGQIDALDLELVLAHLRQTRLLLLGADLHLDGLAVGSGVGHDRVGRVLRSAVPLDGDVLAVERAGLHHTVVESFEVVRPVGVARTGHRD